MTKTEREMTNGGYYAEGAYDTEREARAAAFDIERSNEGQATQVRKSAHGWTVWVETEEQHEKRTLAAS